MDCPLRGDARPRKLLALSSAVLMVVSWLGSATTRADFYVINSEPNSIAVYPDDADGDTAPLRTIQGPGTGFDFPAGLALDLAHGELFVAAEGVPGTRVSVYPNDADGDVAPLRVLSGNDTGLLGASGLAVDTIHDELIVSSRFNDSIRVYPRGADGDVAPLRVIEGPSTGLDFNIGIFVDLVHDEIIVTCPANDSIRVFSRTAEGDAAPLRVLAGPATTLASGNWIFVSLERDELYVSERDSGGGRILVFPRTAEGDVAPLREIVGAQTAISLAQGIVLTSDDELMLANEGAHSVIGFPVTAEGDVAPIRSLVGPATGLDAPSGLISTRAAEGAVGFVGPLVIFADGFESGDTSAWSSSEP